MNFFQLQEASLYALLLGIICFSLALKYTKRKHGSGIGKKPPEPRGAWPIIGHYHLLGGAKQLLHRTLGAMADEYGPVFSVRLGVIPVLVVSNWEVAKECFTNNDKVLLQRPKSLAMKIMGYDHSLLGMAPYGKYWREVRKLAVVELLSNRRLELIRHVRDTEICSFVKDLYEQSVKDGGHTVVEMNERFGDLAMNIIMRVIAGKKYFGTHTVADEECRRCQKALRDFLYFAGIFFASDTVPILGWLDWLKGYVGEMKKTAREIDIMFQNWVNEHRENRLRGNISEGEKDFIHVMLSAMQDDQTSNHDADSTVKATALSLILGGNDTTVITLTWALSLLLSNKDVLKKAQDELDICVGQRRLVGESDIRNLVYLQAIIKETMRLYPAVPLTLPREAMEDCTVAGFHIPAGTRLLVNLWKLHRDPSIWSDPLEFRPERFLNENIDLDVRGQDFEYMPFGSGRRMCPGVSFALQVMHLTLARLLHGFKLGTVLGAAVDLSEGAGLTVPKATPLKVILGPRLPCGVI